RSRDQYPHVVLAASPLGNARHRACQAARFDGSGSWGAVNRWDLATKQGTLSDWHLNGALTLLKEKGERLVAAVGQDCIRVLKDDRRQLNVCLVQVAQENSARHNCCRRSFQSNFQQLILRRSRCVGRPPQPTSRWRPCRTPPLDWPPRRRAGKQSK